MGHLYRDRNFRVCIKPQASFHLAYGFPAPNCKMGEESIDKGERMDSRPVSVQPNRGEKDSGIYREAEFSQQL